MKSLHCDSHCIDLHPATRYYRVKSCNAIILSQISKAVTLVQMAESSGFSTERAQGVSQPKTIETIVEAAKKAFDSSLESDSRELRAKEYDDVITRCDSTT